MTSLFRPATNRWWPPATPDFGAYADAGFNLALTGNALGGLCQRRGPNATVTRERLSNSNLNPSPNPSLNPSPSPNQVTHDELFDANVAASDALSALGILTVFNTGNPTPTPTPTPTPNPNPTPTPTHTPHQAS